MAARTVCGEREQQIEEIDVLDVLYEDGAQAEADSCGQFLYDRAATGAGIARHAMPWFGQTLRRLYIDDSRDLSWNLATIRVIGQG